MTHLEVITQITCYKFAINPIDFNTYVYHSLLTKHMKFFCANSKIAFLLSDEIILLLIGKYEHNANRIINLTCNVL